MKILIILCILCGHAFAQSDIVQMISDTASLRIEAESIVGTTPYRATEHQIIKNYFVRIKDFVDQLKENARKKRRFNNYLESQEMSKFCSGIFIGVSDWEQIKIDCTRNRFFLCAEDVNEYNESKKIFFEILSDVLLKIFQNTSECQ
ncbi:MAG: hypothetical protein JNM93_10880 [Bacteriovoracaceae bacterium]|nr:hypothetical protein [Bacteriovoracaceae bacterium]